MTEQIIIEFISDSTGLQPAEDKLAAIGKIDLKTAQVFKQTNTELQKRVQQFNALSTTTAKVSQGFGVLKHNILDLDKYMKTFTDNFVAGWKDGITDALKEAGFEFDETTGKLKKGSEGAGKSTDSLKAKLRQLTEQMVKLKTEGKDNTEQYKKLSQEAAKLKDAMGDVGAEIRNIGSDTAVFDGLIGVAQGAAGAFAVAQGAAALFGDESEELQEVLLRVNAAMAILQGLQQLQTVLQKESSAAKLADIIITRSQTAAQTIYNFVVGTSIGLTKAFRIALASTGVGLLVIGLIELISALRSTEGELEDVNFELKTMKGRTEGAIEAIKDFTDVQLARAKEAGKAESELIRIRGRGTLNQVKALQDENKGLAERRDQLDSTTQAYFQYNDAIEENNREIKKLNKEALIASIELQTQLTEEQKKAAEEKKQRDEKAAADARKLRLAELNDELAILERQALQAEKGGQIEITIQKKIIAAKAKIDLEAEGLTANQKLLIQEKALNDQLNLQREFNKKSSQEAIEALISRNNAELQNIELASEERLRLTIENLISQAQIEIDAVLIIA